MRKEQLMTAALVVVALAAGAACERKVEAGPVRSRVMVVGESDAKAQPDTAVVTLSVVTQSRRAVEVGDRDRHGVARVVAGDARLPAPPLALRVEAVVARPHLNALAGRLLRRRDDGLALARVRLLRLDRAPALRDD